MANKNYNGHTESFKVDKGSNEIVVHHTDYNDAGRRSYDYSISGSGHFNDHETRNSDRKHSNVSH